jgi:hypothetical protein
VYVGEFNNENVLNAIKELFPPSQYIERFVNKSNIAEFPAYKILISTVDENFSQTYFFDLKK